MSTKNPHMCDYGCNQIAIHKFKNDKQCCSLYITQCPKIRQQNSIKNKENMHGFAKTCVAHNKMHDHEWFQKFINNHGKTAFKNIKFLSKIFDNPIILFCKKHQNVFTRPNIFAFTSSKSGGCNICAKEQQSKKHKLTINNIKKQFIEVHGIKKFLNLDWSNAKYIKKIKPIKNLKCKKHDKLITMTTDVLLRKSTTIAGCEICRVKAVKNHYLKKQYKEYCIYYQSLLEKEFLENIEKDHEPNWFIKNVKNGEFFEYFNPVKNKKSIYESDFLISNEIYEIKSHYWWDRNGTDNLLKQTNINKLNSATKKYQVWLILDGVKINWSKHNTILIS